MSMRQVMIDEINGIISFLPLDDRNKLPESLVKFFSDNAKVLPHEVIDPAKKLKEQELSDETLIMLTYINKILKGEKIVV